MKTFLGMKVEHNGKPKPINVHLDYFIQQVLA
jgi:hypothetical protein